jgi:hypothetical protein
MRTLFRKLYYIRYFTKHTKHNHNYVLVYTRRPLRHVQELVNKYDDFQLKNIEVIK